MTHRLRRLSALGVLLTVLPGLALLPLPRAAFAKGPPPTPTPAQKAPPGPTPPPQADNPKPPIELVDVEDEMLAPVPAAPHVLHDWNEAVALVDAHDADLASARIDVERAHGARRQALAGALPTIVATVTGTVEIIRADQKSTDASGVTTTTTVPPSPTAGLEVVLTQPLVAPRIWYGIGTADHLIDVAKLSVEDRRRALIANVADKIVAVVSAEHVAEINRSELKSALARYMLEKKSVDVGVGATGDLVRFEQDVIAARTELLHGDEDLFAARDQLGLALASSEPYGVPTDISLDAVMTSAGATCKPGELRDRADILGLYAKKEVSERAVTDADLEYIPTLDLVSTLGVSTEPLVGDDGHAAWNIMAVITIPIWDGGLKYGDRRVAKADVEQSKLDIETAERQGKVEINADQRAVALALRTRDLAKRGRDLAQKTKELSDSAFDRGVGTSFDVVDSDTKLREADLALANAEADLVRAELAALMSAAKCASPNP